MPVSSEVSQRALAVLNSSDAVRLCASAAQIATEAWTTELWLIGRERLRL